MTDEILTLNVGSSSIKFALFEIETQSSFVLAVRGAIETMGGVAQLIVEDGAGKPLEEHRWDGQPDVAYLLREVIRLVDGRLDGGRLVAVGHRVVHGGADHVRPARVTPALVEALTRLTSLAPLHEPHNLEPIRIISRLRPELAQIVCFDTAFHHTMPAVARRFGLPRDLEVAGIRRYGFHGLSYEFISCELRKVAPALAAGRVVVAHLGNGASLCALRDGKSIDTTMGFTALDGLVMGTRCGSLDPGVVLYLQEDRGLTVKQVGDLLYHHSGLLGVSGGIASDMRTLLASEDPHAAEAVDLFVFRIAREIGALVSSLGGLDGLVFTAGIGEHASAIRAAVCERLTWLGVKIDTAANGEAKSVIGTAASCVDVRIIPTDEERMIAGHTLQIITGRNSSA